MLKRLAYQLPERWQSELKRKYFGRQIRRRTFRSEEREYEMLDGLIKRDDWVVDVGANVGHYTIRLSEIVGSGGRVIAFEPIPETFAVLAANVRVGGCANVTLVNAAVSGETGVVAMSVPHSAGGARNYYRAHLGEMGEGPVRVLALALDALNLGTRIGLIKVDTEGHELSVLRGMRQLVGRDHPVLIVETESPEVEAYLRVLGYEGVRLESSPNIVFTA